MDSWEVGSSFWFTLSGLTSLSNLDLPTELQARVCILYAGKPLTNTVEICIQPVGQPWNQFVNLEIPVARIPLE